MSDCAGLHSKTEANVGKDLKAFSLGVLASLKTCIKKKDLRGGAIMHDESLKQGIFEESVILQNALISMYAKCGALSEAHQVLSKLPCRNVVSWSALISGYAQNGQGAEALICFDRMQREGFSPDAVTYSSVLKACGLTQDANMGKQIHDEIVCQGLLCKNVILGGALVDMYANCGLLQRAQQVHDELITRSLISWNTLISGHAQNENSKEALSCFERMQMEGFIPNTITYTCLLKLCGITKAIQVGKMIHDEIVKQGLSGKSVVLDTALLDMYGKCGMLLKAREVFEKLSERNVISWNALIAGYVQAGQVREAFDCLQSMQRDGLLPNAVTYACILKACSMSGEVEKGEHIFEKINYRGLLCEDTVLGITLLDMYGKFGMLEKLEMVFGKLHVRDISLWNALITGYAEQGQVIRAFHCVSRMESEGVLPNIISWNALIGGYAQKGKPSEALSCFHLMHCKGIAPDAVTFLCVLNACSHAGLVNEGQIFYGIMIDAYGLTPFMEHFSCIIDLFGRAGDFEMFIMVMNTMPTSDHPQVWAALLGACQKLGDKRLGKLAFDHVILLNDHDVTAYIRLENIYVAAGFQ